MNQEEWNQDRPSFEGHPQKTIKGKYAAETINFYESSPEEEEVAECFNCRTLFESSGSRSMEDGTIQCKNCGTINYPQPISRKKMGVKYPHLDPTLVDNYDFIITEVEACLAKRRPNETERALEWVEKAIALSLRTPDAYLYKALCNYYLTKPRSRLISDSAADVISPLETAKRQCTSFADYKPYRIMAGVIAGRYFKALEFSVKRTLELLQTKRRMLIPPITEIENLEKDLLKHLRQFVVCYQISPNPLFLQREIEYYYNYSSRFLSIPTPALTLKVEGNKYLNINDLQALRNYLSSMLQGKWTICCGIEDIKQEVAQKTQYLKRLIPDWQPPEMHFYAPVSGLPSSFQQAIQSVQLRIDQLQAHKNALEQEARQTQIALQQQQATREAEWKKKLENERREKERKQIRRWALLFLIFGLPIIGVLLGAIQLKPIVFIWIVVYLLHSFGLFE